MKVSRRSNRTTAGCLGLGGLAVYMGYAPGYFASSFKREMYVWFKRILTYHLREHLSENNTIWVIRLGFF